MAKKSSDASGTKSENRLVFEGGRIEVHDEQGRRRTSVSFKDGPPGGGRSANPPLAPEEGGRPEEEGVEGILPGDVFADHEPVRLGLNLLHTYWQSWTGSSVEPARKYGGDTAPYEDAGALGATVARQVGLRDLIWAELATDLTSEEAFTRGQPIQADVAGQLAQPRQDTGQGNGAWLAEALLAAHDAGLKLLLTFGAMGGNGTIDAVLPRASADWEREVTGQDGETYTLDPWTVACLLWSEDHIGRSEDGCDFPVHAGGNPALLAWHMQSLDVSSGYKRACLRRLAGAVGGVLLEAEAALVAARPGATLADVVEGIELFNEIERLSQYRRTVVLPASSWPPESVGLEFPRFRTVPIVEPYQSGLFWGRACFQAAHGLREALGATAGGASVAIRLPGLSSYTEGLNQTWEDRRLALEGLAHGFVAEAVEYLRGLSVLDEEIRAYLPSLLQGIDYHWYHRGLADEDDHVRSIAYLVCEVAEIERVLVEAINGAWHDEADPLGAPVDVLDSFRVSIMETGCGVTETDKQHDTTGGFVPEGIDRERFQSFEVYRRLGGAMASGAPFAGWHSWMAPEGGGCAGHGLREDENPDSASASLAVQRPSWFAFQRIATLLGGAVRGGMVLPDVASRDELEAFLGSDAAHPFVVFRYRGSFTAPDRPEVFSFAWLVLRDPAPMVDGGRRLHARWAWSTVGGAAITVPLTGVALSVFSTSAPLPLRGARWPASAEVDLRAWLHLPLALEDGPVFLLSDREIDWLVLPLVVP